MNLISFIWSLLGEFVIGLVSGLLGGSVSSFFTNISKFWKHL